MPCAVVVFPLGVDSEPNPSERADEGGLTPSGLVLLVGTAGRMPRSASIPEICAFLTVFGAGRMYSSNQIDRLLGVRLAGTFEGGLIFPNSATPMRCVIAVAPFGGIGTSDPTGARIGCEGGMLPDTPVVPALATALDCAPRSGAIAIILFCLCASRATSFRSTVVAKSARRSRADDRGVIGVRS